MADKLQTTGVLSWIRADRLTVDPAYQRKQHKSKINAIARDFDPDAFGVLYVSRRHGGTVLLILDGQQRHASVMMMGWADQKLPCIVYDNLTQAEEADLFRKYNEVRTRPQPLELHEAAKVAGDKRALGIEKIVADRGLMVAAGQGAGRISSIVALQMVYDNASPAILGRVIDVLLHAWGAQSTSFGGEMLAAVGVLLARYPAIDDARLAKVMSNADPADLVRKARILKCELGSVGGNGTRVGSVVAAMLAKLYNNRLAVENRVRFDTELSGRNYWQKAA